VDVDDEEGLLSVADLRTTTSLPVDNAGSGSTCIMGRHKSMSYR
jgi:hypothetical protein